jgi:MFS family permease
VSTATNPFDAPLPRWYRVGWGLFLAVVAASVGFVAGTMAGVGFDACMLSRPFDDSYWRTVFYGCAIGLCLGAVVVVLAAAVPWFRSRKPHSTWSTRQTTVLVAALVVIEWVLWTLIGLTAVLKSGQSRLGGAKSRFNQAGHDPLEFGQYVACPRKTGCGRLSFGCPTCFPSIIM